MIKFLRLYLPVIFLLLFALGAFCQTDTTLRGRQTDTLPRTGGNKPKFKEKSGEGAASFKFGASFLSNNVFFGRADTVTTPIIIPEVKYSLKNGIFFSGNLYYIPNKPTQKLDGGSLAAGYDFDITSDLSGAATFTKLFYSATSTQIASSVSGTFNVNLTYDIGTVISPSLSADYDINQGKINNDFFVTAGIAHDFITAGVFSQIDVLLISPTIAVNAGTQNFYDAYLAKRKFLNPRLIKFQNQLLLKYVSQLRQFNVLDYEVSAPVDYKTGHFTFQFTPTYAIVQNQLPRQIAARLSDQPSIFYFEIGVSLKF